MLVNELLMGLGTVCRDSDDLPTAPFEPAEAIPEVTGLCGTSRGVVSGVEVQNNPLPRGENLRK